MTPRKSPDPKEDLETLPGDRVGDVDRSAIRQMLRLDPAERFRLAVEEARRLAEFDKRINR